MINKIRIKKGSILVVEALSKYSSDNIAPEMLGKFVGVIKENINILAKNSPTSKWNVGGEMKLA